MPCRPSLQLRANSQRNGQVLASAATVDDANSPQPTQSNQNKTDSRRVTDGVCCSGGTFLFGRGCGRSGGSLRMRTMRRKTRILDDDLPAITKAYAEFRTTHPEPGK